MHSPQAFSPSTSSVPFKVVVAPVGRATEEASPLEAVDRRQNQLLEDLDALNQKILDLLSEFTKQLQD